LNLGETLYVGIDTRTGVDDEDYQVPFRFNGQVTKVIFKTGPMQLTDVEKKIFDWQLAAVKDER
jgi:arylsulfatase